MRTKNEALMQEIVEEVDEFYSLRSEERRVGKECRL